MPVDPRERVVARALPAVQSAWRFIHQEEPPDVLERAVRAFVFLGADGSDIVSAIAKAALKLEIEDTGRQMAYALGIVRQMLIERGAEIT